MREENPDDLALDMEMVDDFALPSLPIRAPDEEDPVGADINPNSNTARFIESYPGNAGQGKRKSTTRFEEWLAIQENEGKNKWEPFASEDEWELTRWLIKNVGQKSTDEYLKLSIVSGFRNHIFLKNVLTSLVG